MLHVLVKLLFKLLAPFKAYLYDLFMQYDEEVQHLILPLLYRSEARHHCDCDDRYGSHADEHHDQSQLLEGLYLLDGDLLLLRLYLFIVHAHLEVGIVKELKQLLLVRYNVRWIVVLFKLILVLSDYEVMLECPEYEVAV
jgi:hypothetical protein